MAEIALKTPENEKVLILGVRERFLQPFEATNWVDLRIGFFLSLTDDTDDNLITGLSETITNTGAMPPRDRYYIGVIDSASSSTFIGFTNATPDNHVGDSLLVSSDIDVGTATSDYWRPANSADNKISAVMMDSSIIRVSSPDGLQQHFVQNYSGGHATGYAVLLGIQLLRDNAQSKTLRANIKSSGHSADMLYTNTPTLDVLHSGLNAWPASVQLGPVTFSRLPDTLYAYWPYRQSRLRIHSMGILKAS